MVKKPKLDLSGHLKKTQKRRFLIFLLVPAIAGLSGLIFNSLLNVPWHWQLFLRWVLRGGDVTTIPKKFYKELNELCLTAPPSGQITAHNSDNIELYYGLGSFECQRSSDGQSWIIKDNKSFSDPNEAAYGSQLAVFLVSMEGIDYSYKIEATIPIIKEQ